MKLLAIEFSSPQRSVAAVAGSAAADARAWEAIEPEPLTTRAFALTEKALAQAGFEREAVECLAIGLGPGSYNGIRAAIALAQGWQLAAGVKLVGISSADCLAEQARLAGITGKVAVGIDAQRGEFYLAVYEIDAAGPRAVEPLRLAQRADVEQAVAAGARLVGPEVTQWFPNGQLLFPSAATLGKLALGRADFVPGEQLEPVYLRPTAFVKAPPPRIVLE
jgi:tRNA threonylcarbamoyladenosine biosynthesis protein TsaB